MKRVSFYTLGCKLNYSETSSISRLFEQKGYKKVDFEEGADLYIINTCSVTDHADKKCRKIVREAQRLAGDPFIIIIGCYAQLKPAEIAEIPGVDLVLGASEKFRIMEYLDGLEKKGKPGIYASPVSEAITFHDAYSLNDRTRTFLKIQDGCDYSCSFCTIPLARGGSRSNSIDQVVASARGIAANGIREIVLTGVNTGDFGLRDGNRESRFIDLVRELDEIDGNIRFRVSSIEPNLLNDELIEVIAGSAKFVPHFHIPLQSGSNKVLKMMRRRYLRELYAERVNKIKSALPRACIGADVIVGFPGESESDFLDTHAFITDLEISYLHVFPYSERSNTPAVKFDGSIPGKTRQYRSEVLRNLSRKKRRKFYEDNLGLTAEVLFESDIEDGKIAGFTENYIRAEVKYDPVLLNEIRKVRLIGINSKGLAEISEAGEVNSSMPVIHQL
jgi:threonylcarbamoyladenosine tRNA methylthiotransferase MtaB